ncbi:MAG: hypothetical protein HUU46_19240 [Candidatus Hydrogenedentes bacterium]|nr:hypothetical protein [Candidatus Hydrogenedentota bacterium]
MKKKYFVGVREVHVRYYSVIANNPDEAKARVKERHASVVDEEEQEYANELEPDTWSVEETSDE